MNGRLLSVNVGLPQDVPWRGETVRTAIWKRPVDGPRQVTRLNVEGDGQGDLQGHGGPHRAVFVYQIESYRYWERELGRDDFEWGQFGENFTVEGLADDAVCIGDRFRIGTALFEVSQPRVTCYRLGLRMDEPRMPALVVAHRRPGFYLRVLEEGAVEAGQTVEKVLDGPEGMTVAEIDALLYLPRRSPRDLERALRIPPLSPGWQGSFRELLDQAGDGGRTAAPAWTGLRPLRVVSIIPEGDAIISIGLRDESAESPPPPPPLPGQFLTLRLPFADSSSPVTRTYSLSGPPRPVEFRVSVKREPGGRASGYLHSSLQVGDVLEAGAPRGEFTLSEGDRPVALISAGIGATPVLSMLHALVAARAEQSVWWVQGARNRAAQPFATEVAALLAQLPGARRLICFSQPAPTDRPGVDFDLAGRVTGAVLESASIPLDADFYVCGPATFMEDIMAALTARGVAPEHLRTETFGPSAAITPGVVSGAAARVPHPPAGRPGTGPIVTFSRSNLSVAWDPGHRSLLELAEACDVPVRWACRTGVCHTCQTAVISGAVRYDPKPLEAPEAGETLICCTQPDGELTLDL